mgnify:CR=1 FL=1
MGEAPSLFTLGEKLSENLSFPQSHWFEASVVAIDTEGFENRDLNGVM